MQSRVPPGAHQYIEAGANGILHSKVHISDVMHLEIPLALQV